MFNIITSIIYGIIMAIPYTIMSTYKQRKIDKLREELEVVNTDLNFYKKIYEKMYLEKDKNDK